MKKKLDSVQKAISGLDKPLISAGLKGRKTADFAVSYTTWALVAEPCDWRFLLTWMFLFRSNNGMDRVSITRIILNARDTGSCGLPACG